MRLFWHQRDPRVRDNVGLAAAAREDTVVPVYVYDTDLLATVGPRQRAFLLEGIRRLQERYREFGSDLIVRAGSPEEELVALAEAYDADAVYYNEHYRQRRRERQDRVERALGKAGVDATSLTDLVLVGPGKLAPSYPNHSQFHNDWETVPKRTPVDAPSGSTRVSTRTTTLATTSRGPSKRRPRPSRGCRRTSRPG